MKGLRVAAKLSLAILIVIGLEAGGGAARASHPGVPVWRPYSWPVRPFDRQHPVQAVFGDPRTVYNLQSFGLTGPNRKGSHSFHNGVDISAKAGTPVYPVVSGRVVVAIASKIVVHTDDGRSFQYYHLDCAVHRGQIAVAQRTILGRVNGKRLHVHLAEIDPQWNGLSRVHNPLDPGHLTPYRDRTKPTAVGLYIDNGAGPRLLVAAHLGARDALVVAAVDPPAQPLPDAYSGLPQVPTLIQWRLFHGATHTAWKVAADFRLTQPPRRGFWHIYAPGTYQNNPVFEHRLFPATSGRYLFRLGLDATRLHSGSYRLQVRITDIRRNSSTASWPLQIAGSRR